MMRSSKSSNKQPVSVKPLEAEVSWHFEAIGTQWWIGIYEPVDSDMLESLKQAVAGRIERFDRTYSRFREDSMVSVMARESGTYGLPVGGRTMLTLYRKLYDLTKGGMTPLIGQLLADAGYDASYTLQAGELRRVPAWDDVMRFDQDKLEIKRPVLLDFGAAGKGYLVERVARILRGAGIRGFCVDAGGDMLFEHPNEALPVGLEHPDDPEQVIGMVPLRNESLCGSAGNRRAWGGFNHIMDPKKRNSPSHLKAVWVVAREPMEADGLTTALYFASPQVLSQEFDFEYLLMHEDGKVTQSPGFPAILFTESS